MMGGGNNDDNGQGAFDDSEEDSNNDDVLAMLGVLASIKDGAGGAWDAYNGALAEKPILVKVRRSLLPVSAFLGVILDYCCCPFDPTAVVCWRDRVGSTHSNNGMHSVEQRFARSRRQLHASRFPIQISGVHAAVLVLLRFCCRQKARGQRWAVRGCVVFVDLSCSPQNQKCKWCRVVELDEPASRD